MLRWRVSEASDGGAEEDAREESYAEPGDDTTKDHHLEPCGKGLEDTADGEDECASEEGHPSAKDVADASGEERSHCDSALAPPLVFLDHLRPSAGVPKAPISAKEVFVSAGIRDATVGRQPHRGLPP